MRVSDLHRRILAGKKDELLLDLFPNAAAAYSLRKLRTAYTGNCIEVRRSSDNTTQNIGFVNNVLDTASLLSFVGAGNGFVRTWYDQSGSNYNLFQTTRGQQPAIVDGGNIKIKNNKPSLFFDGVDDFLFFGSNNLLNNKPAFSLIVTYGKRTNYSVNRALFGVAFSGGIVKSNIGGGLVSNKFRINSRRLSSDAAVALNSISNAPVDNLFIHSSLIDYSNATASIYLNNTLDTINTSFGTAGNTQAIGSSSIGLGGSITGNIDGSTYADYDLSEIVMHEFDQNSVIINMINNINDYYNIY
jgi:hypothetical protein